MYNLPHDWKGVHNAPVKEDQGQGAWWFHTEQPISGLVHSTSYMNTFTNTDTYTFLRHIQTMLDASSYASQPDFFTMTHFYLDRYCMTVTTHFCFHLSTA